MIDDLWEFICPLVTSLIDDASPRLGYLNWLDLFGGGVILELQHDHMADWHSDGRDVLSVISCEGS